MEGNYSRSREMMEYSVIGKNSNRIINANGEEEFKNLFVP
jgi:hypothetical protein